MKNFVFAFLFQLIATAAVAIPPPTTITSCPTDPSVELHYWSLLGGHPVWTLYSVHPTTGIILPHLWTGHVAPSSDWETFCTHEAAEDRGLTWAWRGADSVTGISIIGCSANGEDCDPYQGDTNCATALPVLCFSDMTFPVPPNLQTSKHYEWSGGVIATTSPRMGNSFSSLADVDAFCAQTFGANNWRAAEFHDGWGWNMQAYGTFGDQMSRAWIDINDQAAGTCWAR